MTDTRKIQLQNQCRPLRFKAADVRKVFHTLDAAGQFPVPNGELSIVFLTDPEIAAIHGDFLHDPTPTDVITFPGDPDMDFAGEIFVSVDHARDYAKRKNLNFSQELTLYLIHGYLHLAGFDDLVPEKKRQMRRAEKKCLQILLKAEAIPAFSLSDK